MSAPSIPRHGDSRDNLLFNESLSPKNYGSNPENVRSRRSSQESSQELSTEALAGAMTPQEGSKLGRSMRPKTRQEARQRAISFYFLCAAETIEGLDMTIFGSCYEAFAEDLGFSPLILRIYN